MTYIKQFTTKLKERMNIEFKRQDKSSVYGFTQRTMAYNSNKIEGSTLTEKQTASIFETGTIITDNTETIFRTKDIEELTGHFKMFNYAITTIDEPLSEQIILTMHKCLKECVFEDMANGYAIGAYKTRANLVSDINTTLPADVPGAMEKLLNQYSKINHITINDVAKFHAKFENIHPFQDGNGRVGRMIIFRECLRNDLIPVIIKDKDKAEYMNHLNNAQKHNNFRGLTEYFKKEQNNYVNDTIDLIFNYTDVPDIISQIQNEMSDENQYE